MSVSGWETRSIASSVATEDRRSHRHQHPHMQQSTRAQFRPQTPQYEPRNHMSSTASQSSHVSRHRDSTSRHSSFPVQQQQQNLDYYRHADNQQQYQQPQQQPRRQSMHRNERHDPAPYREQERQSIGQRRSSVSSATPKRQSQPQPQPTLPYEQYGWQQDQHQHQYTESRKAPSNYDRDEYNLPPAAAAAAANGHRRSSVSRQSNQTSYHQEEYQQPPEPLEEDYYEPSPPPAPSKRQVSPPAAKPAAAAPLESVDEEPVNIDDVLLGKRYSVHVISHLYHFQRQELGDYANELVKFLRGHAVMAYEEEFGYSVIIKYTSECVVFQVVETRDLHAEFLIERLEQPQRPENKPVDKNDFQEEDVRQRSGGFVIYFPKSAEDAPSKLRIHRRSQGSHSNENGSDNSHASNGNASQSRGDAKYAFLVRGNEELMSWVSSWVQRRFQCAVGRHVVRITDENLRRVARNWIIESLEREERVLRGLQRKSEKMQKTTGDEPVHTGATMQSKPPILVKYRTKKTSEAVKSFTLTMPWASVRRVHAAMDSGVSSVLGSIPEVLETLEQQYFGNLEKDMKEMELVGFQMEEVEVDVLGKIKFFKSSMIHSILQSYLDIFAVQQQQPASNEAESTF